MRLYYLKNGHKYCTKRSNEDVEIILGVVNNRTTTRIKALTDITLVKAVDTIPFNVNFRDLYFLNGYQSWTDTKEFKLAKREHNIKKAPHIISHMFAMDKYGDSSFYRYSIKKSHGHDIFYSRGENEMLIYSHNFKTAYLIIELIKDRKSVHLISDVEHISLTKGEEVTIFANVKSVSAFNTKKNLTVLILFKMPLNQVLQDILLRIKTIFILMRI